MRVLPRQPPRGVTLLLARGITSEPRSHTIRVRHGTGVQYMVRHQKDQQSPLASAHLVVPAPGGASWRPGHRPVVRGGGRSTLRSAARYTKFSKVHEVPGNLF